MQPKTTNPRIQAISQMLLELAEGNFFYTVKPTYDNDEIEALVTLVNLLAEEFNQTLFHFAHINVHKAYQPIVQFSLILDPAEHIVAITPNAEKLLKQPKNELLGKAFTAILSANSTKTWQNIRQQLSLTNEYHSQALSFKSGKKLLLTTPCTISKLTTTRVPEEYFLVSSVHIRPHARKYRLPEKTKADFPGHIIRNQQDIKALQEIYDYILLHLDEALPPLKQLANQFGINEFKLKKGFRQFYNTTVFKFYMEERLKKAHMMIQHTALSLKCIADQTGFKSFPHFSRVFKQRFGYNASELRV